MAGSTSITPMKVEQLIIKLKLLPLDMRIEITNELGKFFIQDLEVDAEACIVNLVLLKVPQE